MEVEASDTLPGVPFFGERETESAAFTATRRTRLISPGCRTRQKAPSGVGHTPRKFPGDATVNRHAATSRFNAHQAELLYHSARKFSIDMRQISKIGGEKLYQEFHFGFGYYAQKSGVQNNPPNKLSRSGDKIGFLSGLFERGFAPNPMGTPSLNPPMGKRVP